MKYFLFLLAIAALAFGLFAGTKGTSAIHEIEALIAGLIFTTALAGAGIIEAIQGATKKVMAVPKTKVEPGSGANPATGQRPAA